MNFKSMLNIESLKIKAFGIQSKLKIRPSKFSSDFPADRFRARKFPAYSQLEQQYISILCRRELCRFTSGFRRFRSRIIQLLNGLNPARVPF